MKASMDSLNEGPGGSRNPVSPSLMGRAGLDQMFVDMHGIW